MTDGATREKCINAAAASFVVYNLYIINPSLYVHLVAGSLVRVREAHVDVYNSGVLQWSKVERSKRKENSK